LGSGPLRRTSKEPYSVSVVLYEITYYMGGFIRASCSIGWSVLNISKEPYTLEIGPIQEQFTITLKLGVWSMKYLRSTFQKNMLYGVT
jgi:hypothetical protein